MTNSNINLTYFSICVQLPEKTQIHKSDYMSHDSCGTLAWMHTGYIFGA